MFTQLLEPYKETLEENMRVVVDLVPEADDTFHTMIQYPLGWVDENGQPHNIGAGKRLRPLLLLLCNESAGGNWRDALPAAIALEFLHNFSLVHDDIQDASLTRHGRPTVWKIWGVAQGINVGDALFSLAHTALASLSKTKLQPPTILQIWQIFNAATLELTRGQHLDMTFESRSDITSQDYLGMIQGKSAALLAAGAQIGAVIATQDDVVANRYAKFGLNLGLAFQIRDDILGIWGDPAITGKSAATDILSRKKTFPILYGLEQSDGLAHYYQQETLSNTDVEQVIKLLEGAGAREFAVAQETHFHEQAIAALQDTAPSGRAAVRLRQFIDTVFQRSR